MQIKVKLHIFQVQKIVFYSKYARMAVKTRVRIASIQIDSILVNSKIPSINPVRVKHRNDFEYKIWS